ncbi:MAG TPA: hypothetical protein VK926_06975 [Gaiellaceae bacterium]|nr:hypothetical protein [Gaiellaceae bacterium]
MQRRSDTELTALAPEGAHELARGPLARTASVTAVLAENPEQVFPWRYTPVHSGMTFRARHESVFTVSRHPDAAGRAPGPERRAVLPRGGELDMAVVSSARTRVVRRRA